MREEKKSTPQKVIRSITMHSKNHSRHSSKVRNGVGDRIDYDDFLNSPLRGDLNTIVGPSRV